MEPGEIPITADLWARLRRLDPQCLMHLSRREPDRRQWRGQRRVWAVTITTEDSRVFDYVAIEHPRLAVALLAAVEEAERRGWARSSTPPARDAG